MKKMKVSKKVINILEAMRGVKASEKAALNRKRSLTPATYTAFNQIIQDEIDALDTVLSNLEDQDEGQKPT